MVDEFTAQRWVGAHVLFRNCQDARGGVEADDALCGGEAGERFGEDAAAAPDVEDAVAGGRGGVAARKTGLEELETERVHEMEEA